MVELAYRPATVRVATALVAVVFFAGVIALVTHDGGLAIGDARLHADGNARVTSVDGVQRTVHGTVGLHNGDVVEAIDGSFVVDLPDGSNIEGRAGRAGAESTRLRIDKPVELVGGDALVTTKGTTSIDAGGNHLDLQRGSDNQTAARVSRALAVTAGVYHGQATVDSAGQQRGVPALRQVDVAAIGRPSALKALQPDDADPWDRRFLGAAMDLGRTLDSYSKSYTQSLAPTDGRTVGFYTALLPDLAKETAFTPTLLDTTLRQPGELLVGAAIATIGRHGSFADRWQQVFAFRDEQASWGLVALDQGVDGNALLAAVQRALTSTTFQFAEAARAPANPSSTPTTTTGTAPSSGNGGNGSSSSPTTSPPPTTSLPTPTVPPPTVPPVTTPPNLVPPPAQGLVDGLVSQVNGLLGGLLKQP